MVFLKSLSKTSSQCHLNKFNTIKKTSPFKNELFYICRNFNADVSKKTNTLVIGVTN